AAPADAPWITGFTPNGGALPARGESTVRVQLDTALLPADSVSEALILLDSNLGSGEVRLLVANGVDTSIGVDLRDEPGVLGSELRDQIILAYNSPLQDRATYLLSAT